jgi:hypothetical protein
MNLLFSVTMKQLRISITVCLGVSWANWALAGQVVDAPTVVAAELEWARCLDGKRATQGLWWGVSPGGVAPSIVRTFAGDDGGVGSLGLGLRGWRSGWVKDKVTDMGECSGSEKIPFCGGLLLLGTKKLGFSAGQFPPCVPKLQHGRPVTCYFCCYSDVIEGSNSIVDKKALPDMGVEHPEAHGMNVWVLLGADRVGVGARV